VLARAGVLFGSDGQPCDRLPIPISDLSAGMYGALGILAALGDSERTGIHLEISLMSSALSWSFMRILRELSLSSERPVAIEPASAVFSCSDGRFVSLSAVEADAFSSLMDLVGAVDLRGLAEISYFDRSSHANEINGRIASFAKKIGSRQLLSLLAERGIPCAPINRGRDVLLDPAVLSHEIIFADDTQYSVCPIEGLPSIRNKYTSDVDEHGGAVRSSGWSALETTSKE